MSTHAGDIFIDARLNDKPYHQGLRSLDRGAGAIASKIGRKLAAGLTVAAFGKFIKSATDAGASLNAMNAIVDAALPNMTAQVDRFAKAAGAAFGLSETQAKGFIGKFASMASAMGYTEKQAYSMSTALTGLAGDVASYYHISQDEAFTKLNAVFTGETEALKQLGVVMTQNALDAFALEQGYGKVTSQMTEMEKTTLRYQFVMDRLKLTAGDFSKYANTWSGSIATIKLNWANFMATVGQGIINILLPLLQVIARVSNALTALGSRFLAWTQRVTGKSKGLGAIKNAVSNAFGRGTQKDLNGASNSLGGVGDATGGVGKAAKDTKKQVQALKRELLGFDQITKLTKQDADTGTSGDSGVGGVGGIGGGGLDYDSLLGVDAAEQSKNKINDILSKINVPKSLSEAFDKFKTSLEGLFKVLKDVGSWAFENVLKPLGQWMMDKGLPAALNLMSGAIDTMSGVLKVVFETVKALWEPVLKPIFSFLADRAVSIINTVAKGLQFLGGVLSDAAEGIKSVAAWAGTLKEKWEALKDTAEKKVAKFKTEFVESVKDKWDKLQEWWDGLKDKSKTVSVTAVLKDKKDEIKDKLLDFKAKMTAFTTAIDWADRWLNFKARMSDWFLAIDWNKRWMNFKARMSDWVLAINWNERWMNFKARVAYWVLAINWNERWMNFKARMSTWIQAINWKDRVMSFTAKIIDFTDGIRASAKKLFGWTVGRADGGVYSGGRWKPIQRYASGGTPGSGQMFVARESGPELVGTLGGHTAVMNNDQIVASVSNGVAKAMSGLKFKASLPELKTVTGGNRSAEDNRSNDEIKQLLQDIIKLLNALDLDVQLDGESIKQNVVRRINNHTRATGELEIII